MYQWYILSGFRQKKTWYIYKFHGNLGILMTKFKQKYIVWSTVLLNEWYDMVSYSQSIDTTDRDKIQSPTQKWP